MASQKKIGVQYSSINGNGFGGYGEIVFGTEGTLILEREQELKIIKSAEAAPQQRTRLAAAAGRRSTRRPAARPTAVAKTAGGGPKSSRGYAEELEHWAWCIRNPAPENKPHCGPKVAMGDAILALTANMAARQATPIEFKKNGSTSTATKRRRALGLIRTSVLLLGPRGRRAVG